MVNADTHDGVAVFEATAKVYHIYTQWIVNMQSAEFSCSVPKPAIIALTGSTGSSMPNSNSNHGITVQTGQEDESDSDSRSGSNSTSYFNSDSYYSPNTHSSHPQNYNSLNSKHIPFVTFVGASGSCLTPPRSVMKIEYPKRMRNSVGICLKISYGDLDTEKILEWFEFVRLLGVTRVFSFVSSDMDASAKRVFDYYNSTGFLETNPIDPATRISKKYLISLS